MRYPEDLKIQAIKQVTAKNYTITDFTIQRDIFKGRSGPPSQGKPKKHTVIKL
jgi:hypothetical protein